MKKYLVSLYGKDVEIMQDDDGKFIKPELVKYYEQYGTAVKPSYEPIIVARKPFKTSVAENIMQYGVGGINIDECRIETEELKTQKSGNTSLMGGLRNDDTNGGYECIPSELGRFPANVIHDGSEEAIKDMPNTNGSETTKTGQVYGNTDGRSYMQQKPHGININDSGSASRYFKCCEVTNKDKEEDVWKNLNVSIVERYFMILKAIKECIVQMNVEDSQKKNKNQNVKFVENLLNLCETFIVQENVETKNLDFKKEELQVIQDFIIDYEKCIQIQNLVQYVENKVNIDIIQIMINLLKLYGYVKVATTSNILQNEKTENKRYLYTSKASKKDRDEGLDMFENYYELKPNIPQEIINKIKTLLNY